MIRDLHRYHLLFDELALCEFQNLDENIFLKGLLVRKPLLFIGKDLFIRTMDVLSHTMLWHGLSASYKINSVRHFLMFKIWHQVVFEQSQFH